MAEHLHGPQANSFSSGTKSRNKTASPTTPAPASRAMTRAATVTSPIASPLFVCRSDGAPDGRGVRLGGGVRGDAHGGLLGLGPALVLRRDRQGN